MFEHVDVEDLADIQRAYRVAVEAGGDIAQELMKKLDEDLPLPRPWWFAAVGTSLYCAGANQSPMLSPDDFDNYEIYEAKNRANSEKSCELFFNPFVKDLERRDHYIETQRAVVDSVLELSAYGTNPFTTYDDQIALLLGAILIKAVNAGEGHQFPVGEKLQTFLNHYDCPRCAPVPDNVARAVSILRKAVPLLRTL